MATVGSGGIKLSVVTEIMRKTRLIIGLMKNKITAIMKNDDYIDLTPDYPYEVEKVFSSGHIKLTNGPRRYLANSFNLYNKGERITFKKAYMLYKLHRAMENVRMK